MKQFLRYIYFLFIFSTFLVAQEYRYNLTPYFGYNFTDKDYWLGDSFVGGINFDSYLTNSVGIRTGYERLFSMEVKDNPVSKYHMDRFYLNLIVRNNDISNLFTPYIAFGGGHESSNADELAPAKWFYNVTLGSTFCLNDQLQFSPEVKMLGRTRSDRTVIDYVATMGLVYQFGAPKVEVREKIVQQRVEVPVEHIITKRVEVPIMMCQIPKIVKDYCDNSYYIQVASAPVCPSCPRGYKDKKFLHKVRSKGYSYTLYRTKIASGQEYVKVLIGPYRCKKSAYQHICRIKKELGCDAFVYRKKGVSHTKVKHYLPKHKRVTHKRVPTIIAPEEINPSWLK